MKGRLFTISGPSGVGKSSLIRAHLAAMPQCRRSVSVTTRAAREGERQHQHYHFVSRAEFEKAVRYGAFLEYAQVGGNFCGTYKQEVVDALVRGSPIIIETDVQGVRRVKQAMPEAIPVLIMPPSPELETLRERLGQQGGPDLEDIELRLLRAAEELTHRNSFKYVIVNGDFADARKKLTDFIQFHCKEETS